jgi:hypothetical protein
MMVYKLTPSIESKEDGYVPLRCEPAADYVRGFPFAGRWQMLEISHTSLGKKLK